MLSYGAVERSYVLMEEMTEEIARVYSMGIKELYAKFEELYGFPPG